MASSLSIDELSDDEFLAFWNEPQNLSLILNAELVGCVSVEEFVRDNLGDGDEEFASKVIHAVPEDLDSDPFFDWIDKEKLAKLLEEKNFSSIETYFQEIKEQFAVEDAEYDKTIQNLAPSASNFFPTRGGGGSKFQNADRPQDDLGTPGIILSSPQSTLRMLSLIQRTLRPVGDDVRIDPFQSVGLLYWLEPVTDEMKPPTAATKCATAFYIGEGKIVTAAHNFAEERREERRSRRTTKSHYLINLPKKALFIPAVKIVGSDVQDPLGRYVVSDIVFEPSLIHTQQEEPATWASNNDICSATISIQEGPEVQLHPLQILPYEEMDRTVRERTWQLIGYRKKCNSGTWIIQMMQMEAREFRIVRSGNPNEIVSCPGAADGMSGGPWIPVGNNVARGLQSATDPFKVTFSRSPRVTEELLRSININYS